MERHEQAGLYRVSWIHAAAREVWTSTGATPASVQARCMQAWDTIGDEMGLTFKPLVPVEPGTPVRNVIFGSGGFSTGAFQAAQFTVARQYTGRSPVELAAIVSNKSVEHGCKARDVATEHGVPLVELDFIDWYHDTIDPSEPSPIAASRYWYPPGDPARPAAAEIERRFQLRQVNFHGALGDALAGKIDGPVDIVSARGYNFQFCGSMFPGQERMPHVNDTHPADLTYVDPATGAKRYPGWQSGAIALMLADGHARFRGSLIEVPLMDSVSQIDELDEGALLAIGGGVQQPAPPSRLLDAVAIQDRMKLVDDFTFCTLEPAGLLLAWGISERPAPVIFQDIDGTPVEVTQHVIVVGDRACSGVDAFGRDLQVDLGALRRFLVP